MADKTFAQQVTEVARQVARSEFRLREARRRLAELEEQHREVKRQLRLLVQSTEPYVPPTPEETRAAAARAQEHE